MSSGFSHLRDDLIHQGAVVATYESWFRGPDGNEFRRDVVRHPGAVSAVALDGDDIFLVRQYRAPIDTELWEIPAGKLDVEGEAPEATIVRELGEEIGRHPDRLDFLMHFHHSPGFCDELQYIYLARDLRPVEVAHDGVEEEHMVVEQVPFIEAVNMTLDGRITDGKSVAGILVAARRLGI